jgi:hypothetical protein
MPDLSIIKHPITLPLLSSIVTLVSMFIYNKRTKDKKIDDKTKYVIGTLYVVLLVGINLFVYNKFFCNKSIIPRNNKKPKLNNRNRKMNINVPSSPISSVSSMASDRSNRSNRSDMQLTQGLDVKELKNRVDVSMPDF